MKAVPFDRFGAPTVLRSINVPDPVAGPRDAALAHELLAARQELGKIILKPDLP